VAEETLVKQTKELCALWGEMLQLQPRGRAPLPIDLQRAHKRLDQLQAENAKSFDDSQAHLLFRIGLTLRQHDAPMTMGELSQVLNVPLSTATRTVDWLVASGYVERLHDPADRRVVRVTLSQTGRQLSETIDHHLYQKMHEFLHHFSPQERKTLLRMTRRVVQVISAMSEPSFHGATAPARKARKARK
jgi:DNA-binding MarR family transcriptional regulator